jgi:hypothetical protein
MIKTYAFEAEIKKVPEIDGTYIAMPFDAREEFSKGRVKVHATFDGESYDGSIVNMGIKYDDGSTCYYPWTPHKIFVPRSENSQVIM